MNAVKFILIPLTIFIFSYLHLASAEMGNSHIKVVRPQDPVRTFSSLLTKCPKSRSDCAEFSFSLNLPTDFTDDNLIPENAFVEIKSDKKTISVRLKHTEVRASCSGRLPYGRFAFVGDNVLLSSNGPVTLKELFGEIEVSVEYQDPSYSTKIRDSKSKTTLWMRDGASLDAKSFFVKENKIARKVGGNCLILGERFVTADWCSVANGFATEAKQDGNQTIHSSNDGQYEFVVQMIPAC